MPILNPKGKSASDRKKSNTILIVIMIIFVILGFKYTTDGTFEEHYVLSDVDGLVYAVDSLIHGDVYGFFDGLVDSMVVIGLFIVVFALIHFLITHIMGHIFKSKAVATTLSIAITLYAFIDHRIYNYLISLNAFVIAFIVFCAMVIMIWGLGKTSYKNYKHSKHELEKAKHAAKSQYTAKGYVDGDIMNHIRKLQRDIDKAKIKYEKDLNNK